MPRWPAHARRAVWFLVGGLVDRGGIADRSPDAAGQLLDRCPGEQDAEAEASPSGSEPYGVEDEDPVAHGFEQVVQVRVELAGARIEDSPGDGTQVGVLAVEQAEGVTGLVDVDQHDGHVADVGLHVRAAVVEDVGRDMPALRFLVRAGPPELFVPVGEVMLHGSSGGVRPCCSFTRDASSVCYRREHAIARRRFRTETVSLRWD